MEAGTVQTSTASRISSYCIRKGRSKSTSFNSFIRKGRSKSTTFNGFIIVCFAETYEYIVIKFTIIMTYLFSQMLPNFD
jgi:hypothetical protein